LNEADIEAKTERIKFRNLKNLKNFVNEKKEDQTNSDKKGAFKKIFFKHGLFNRSLEREYNNNKTVDSDSRHGNKELLFEIETKHNKIVEKIKKKNFYEPITKLPYVCIKSDRGQEGTLSLNYNKILEIKPEVKRNYSKILQKRFSQPKINTNQDGEAMFNRMFEKNFKINKNLSGLNF
jgi:hypothetical protein